MLVFYKQTKWLLGVMACLISVPANAAIKPLLPNFDAELKNCVNNYGNPVAPTPAGVKATPTTADGATTVSPQVANCIIDALGEEILVFAIIPDAKGIDRALAYPLLGVGREFTEQEKIKFEMSFDFMTDERKDRAILVYCQDLSCGNSYNAVQHLNTAGYTRVLWLREGIKGWEQAGLPVGVTRKGGIPQIANPVPPLASYSLSGDRGYPYPPDYWKNRLVLEKAVGANLGQLCVSAKSIDWSGFEQAIAAFEASAGADPSRETQASINRKVRALWQRSGQLFTCNDMIGDVSVLKISANSDQHLVRRAIDKWQLSADSLNQIDITDGRTLLDFVVSEYNNPHAHQAKKDRYADLYVLLRASGAKLLNELISLGAVESPEMLQAKYLRSYQKLADSGDASAMFHLAHVYRLGSHIPANPTESQLWQARAEQRAIDTNDFATLGALASWYFPTSIEKAQWANADKAFRFAQLAHNGGDLSGSFWLVRAYLSGVGTSPDYNRAIDALKASRSEYSGAYERFVAEAYINLNDKENAGLWLRILGELVEVKGQFRDYWFERLGISKCGPLGNGWAPIPCDGRKRADDVFKPS